MGQPCFVMWHAATCEANNLWEACCCGRSDGNEHVVGVEDRLFPSAVLSAGIFTGQNRRQPSFLRRRSLVHRHEAWKCPLITSAACRSAEQLPRSCRGSWRQHSAKQMTCRWAGIWTHPSIACGSKSNGHGSLFVRHPCGWATSQVTLLLPVAKVRLPSVSCSTSCTCGSFQAQLWLNSARCRVGILLCVGPGSQPPERAAQLI